MSKHLTPPPSLFQPPRSIRQAVKPPSSANVSEGGVILGRLTAVDKCWKCYPSLKHHSFTYCKCASLWAASPHCWQGGRQHPAALAISEHHHIQPQTHFSLQRTVRKNCREQTASLVLVWVLVCKIWATCSVFKLQKICSFLLISSESKLSFGLSVGTHYIWGTD